MRVLLDGWPLVRAPLSPAAVHLWSAWEALRVAGEEVIVAWPASPPPPWEAAPAEISPQPPTSRGRLRWEQRTLAQQARYQQADLLYGTAGLPLWRAVPTLHAPAPETSSARSGGWARLRLALGEGGAARGTTLSSAALPPPPPLSSPASLPLPRPLPEAFVLFHAPLHAAHWERALEVWLRWAAGSIGGSTPLVILGAPDDLTVPAPPEIADTIIPYPAVNPALLPAVYAHAVALFHPLVATAWGSPLRLALAWGVPVVACEEAATAAMVGTAAYLAPCDAARDLAAALVTVVVEDDVADALRESGRARAATWTSEAFLQAVHQAARA
ncbi:MAG TPA: glycosyltransferase family 1 protein [Chloroflexi bacterium]|nr:glycosyltransferase family 1 protein [Chloroflexota bacterium]